MLVLDQLVSGYGQRPVVQGLSVSLEPGDFVCLIGRNGAGKSTLMRTISGLQPALSGSALLNTSIIAELSAKERAEQISIVTTERVSSPGMFARDVLVLGRQPYTDWRGRLSDGDLERIRRAAQVTGVHEFLPRLIDDLSDGQRQRVMIARAIAQSSRVMVLDEITAFLDLPSRVQIMSLLKQHAEEQQQIVLLSSHDLELSLEICDQIWIINNDQVFVGTPDEIVNSGIIGEAFETPEVEFDSENRKFTLRRN